MAQAGAQSIWKHRRQIVGRRMPTILFYGASHMTNLKKWVKTPQKSGGATWLDRMVLRHKHFCAVGGSRFATVHDRVQGKNVPDTQPFRGDLWRYTIRVKELKPHYILISLGFNDCDRFDRRYKAAMKEYRNALAKAKGAEVDDGKFTFCDGEHWIKETKEILDAMDEVIDRLQKAFPDSKLVYVGVMRSEKWCEETLLVCDRIEQKIGHYHGIKMAHLGGFIKPKMHIRPDKVHLNSKGYRLFMDKVIARVVDMWFAPMNHGKKPMY